MAIDHCLRVNGQKNISSIPERFLYVPIETKDVACTLYTCEMNYKGLNCSGKMF